MKVLQFGISPIDGKRIFTLSVIKKKSRPWICTQARPAAVASVRREPYQKVVLRTNYATPEIRKRAMALGADAVFDKSSELEELLTYCMEQTAEHEKFEVQEAECAAIAKSRSDQKAAGESLTMPSQ